MALISPETKSDWTESSTTFLKSESCVVLHKRNGTARLEHLVRLANVFGRNDVHVHLFLGIHHLEHPLGSAASCSHYVLAVEVLKVLVNRSFLTNRRVLASKIPIENSTCRVLSAVLVVEPHSRSTVPFFTSGIRVCDVTRLYRTFSLGILSYCLIASTIFN